MYVLFFMLSIFATVGLAALTWQSQPQQAILLCKPRGISPIEYLSRLGLAGCWLTQPPHHYWLWVQKTHWSVVSSICNGNKNTCGTGKKFHVGLRALRCVDFNDIGITGIFAVKCSITPVSGWIKITHWRMTCIAPNKNTSLSLVRTRSNAWIWFK